MIHSLLIDFTSEIIQASPQLGSISFAHMGWVFTQREISAAMQAFLNTPVGTDEAEQLLGAIFSLDYVIPCRTHCSLF